MRLIKSSFEILEQEPGIQGIYKQIERAGRTCYKSEDRITEDSAEKFVNMIKDRQHTAMLEHGTVYLETENPRVYYKYVNKQYSKVNIIKYTKTGSDIITPQNPLYERGHVTTNYRVLYENDWLDDLKYLCEPTEYHEKRITVKFICDRGVSHEFVRHRVFSFAQESTRYCNYSKDKFGNELTFIIPYWTNIPEGQSYWHDGIGYRVGADIQNKDFGYIEKSPNYFNFLSSLEESEKCYLRLLNEGWVPQQARSILPNSLKTELVMTGTVEQWKGFFKLRCDKAAHPQARELAIPLKEEFIKRNLINN
jgi:thymidylate synthase (FAD)